MAGTGQRPLGVAIVAIVIVLTGIGLVIRGIVGLVQGGQGGAGIVVSFVLLAVGVIYALVAKGIWSGNRGSRLIVAILTLIALVGSVITLFEPGEVAVSVAQIVIALVILALLFNRRASAYFA